MIFNNKIERRLGLRYNRSSIDLGPLIGGMYGASHPASSYIDPNADLSATGYVHKLTGEPVDASDPMAVPATPYKTPGFWANVLSPETAAQVNQANFNYQNAPIVANQQYDIQRGLVGRDVSTIPNQYQPFGDNTQANITAGKYAGLSPQALLSGRTDVASMNLGGAEQAAIARFNTDTAQAQTQANETERQVMRGLLGTPANEAYTESLGDKYNAGEYSGNLALQPRKFYDQGLMLGNDITQQAGLAERLPYANVAANNDAKLNALISDTRLGLEPYTARQLQNESVGGAFSSGYAPVMPPVGNRINSDGTITPLTRNPGGLYAPMMGMAAMQDGGMNPMGGGTSVVNVNGKKVVVANPKQDINPLGVRINPLKAQSPLMDEEESLKARLEQLRAARSAIKPLPSSRGNVIEQGLKDTGKTVSIPYQVYKHLISPAIDWFNQSPQD